MFGFEQYREQPSTLDGRPEATALPLDVERVVIPIIAVLLILWLASGFYVVGPGEVGVVLQFGRQVGHHPVRTQLPPSPADPNHYIVNVRS